MVKNQFSNDLSKLATIEQAKERYKLSRYTLMKLAKGYGALIKLSNQIVRIDIEKFDVGIAENASQK